MSPCDTIQTVNVVLGKMDFKLFVAALKRANMQNMTVHEQQKTVYFSYAGTSCTYANGQLSMRDKYGVDKDATTAFFKRIYSNEVVLSQAKKFGWQVKQLSPFKYEVIKR